LRRENPDLNMPITFNYDPELKILFTTAQGGISLADLQEHLKEESEKKALEYRELVDASNVWNDLTPEQVRTLVHRL
jgi:hypothetical protein